MTLASFLADKLRLPDSPVTVEEMKSDERLIHHRNVLLKKPSFRDVALDMQQQIVLEIESRCRQIESLPIIEIGAGVIPLSELLPGVLSTDIELSQGLGCVLNATHMPFASNQIRAITAQNVFHHIQDLDAAIREADRVLVPGGLLVLIEPYYGRFASLIFPSLFSSEGYDKKLGSYDVMINHKGEEIPNQAVSYSYFANRKGVAIACAPQMRVIYTSPLRSGLRYLCSGALNFRKLVPDSLLAFLRRVEKNSFAGWFLDRFAIHWIIVIQKQNDTI